MVLIISQNHFVATNLYWQWDLHADLYQMILSIKSIQKRANIMIMSCYESGYFGRGFSVRSVF